MGKRDLAGTNVVLMGAYDYDYPREKSLHEGFKQAGASVFEARYAQRELFPGPKKVALLPYFCWLLVRQLNEIRGQTDSIDLFVVTKFNPLLLPLAAFYAWRLDARLVYDLFVSLYRTAEMRGVTWLSVKLTQVLELLMYRLPDYHLVGTNQFIELYSQMYSVPIERFVRIPPGADEDRFYPRDIEKREHFTALYWGNFLPHHGVEVILNAAAELKDEEAIEFVFLGAGPRQEAAQQRATQLGLSNVSFEGFVPDEDLHRWVAKSHVCLGVFSNDVRALSSITNKVCESVASGKATITEQSPATCEMFTQGEDIYLVLPENPKELADAILKLQQDPALIEQLEAGASRIHEREFSVQRISALLSDAFRAGERPDSPSNSD